MSEPSDPTAREGGERSASPTSFHFRRAQAGHQGSLEWVVTRFSPLLLAQAAYRLGPRLRRLYDAEDLVSEVWAIVLPKLATLSPHETYVMPTVLKFLSTTLLYRVNDLVEKHIVRGSKMDEPAGISDGSTDGPGAAVADDTSGVVTRAVRSEFRHAVDRALEELAPGDREIIVLRGIEQVPNKTVAVVLGKDPKTVSKRYERALERLRRRLPGSVFEEIPSE